MVDVPGTSKNYFFKKTDQLPRATSSVSSEDFVKRYPDKEELRRYFKNAKKLSNKRKYQARRLAPRRLSNEGHYDYWARMQKIRRGYKWYDFDDYDDYDVLGEDLFAIRNDLTGELTEYQKKLLKDKKKELAKKEEEEYFKKLRDMTRFQRIFLWISYKLHKVGRTWLTHFFLMLAIVVYTLIGGLIFHVIEGNDQSLQDRNPLEDRPLVTGNISELILKNRSKSEVAETLTVALKEYEYSVRTILNENSSNKRGQDERNWGYWSSVFFCFTVYTTIGYGHMSPDTTTGRAVVILYAILGVPLFLIVMSDFGKALTTISKSIWAGLRLLYYSKSFQKGKVKLKQKGAEIAHEDPNLVDTTIEENPDDFKIDDSFNLPLPIAITLLLIYIFLGALLFTFWEDFSFIVSYYFVFTSIATIGFGDFVPLDTNRLLGCILYLMIGLSLTSMCINILREQLVLSLVSATSKVGMEIDPQQLYTEKFDETSTDELTSRDDENEEKFNIETKLDKMPQTRQKEFKPQILSSDEYD